MHEYFKIYKTPYSTSVLRTATTIYFTQQTRLTPGGTASLAGNIMHKSLLTKPYYVHSTKPIRLRMERTVSQTLRQTRGEGNTKRFKQNQRKNTNRTRSPHATLSSPHHLHNKQKDEKKERKHKQKKTKRSNQKKKKTYKTETRRTNKLTKEIYGNKKKQSSKLL